MLRGGQAGIRAPAAVGRRARRDEAIPAAGTRLAVRFAASRLSSLPDRRLADCVTFDALHSGRAPGSSSEPHAGLSRRSSSAVAGLCPVLAGEPDGDRRTAHAGNHLLALLPPAEHERFVADCTAVDLEFRQHAVGTRRSHALRLFSDRGFHFPADHGRRPYARSGHDRGRRHVRPFTGARRRHGSLARARCKAPARACG